jgi:hypothetical protein
MQIVKLIISLTKIDAPKEERDGRSVFVGNVRGFVL